MTKKEYIDRVLLIMNEASMGDTRDNMFIGADTAQIDRQIEGSYVDAWRRCVKVMPGTWFENKSFKPNNTEHEADLAQGTGYVEIPEDFYQLTMFKMEGWQRPVHNALLENTIVLALQSNEYTRGTPVRPVCVIGVDEVNSKITRVLRYYSLPKSATNHIVEKAIYIPAAKSLKGQAEDYELHISPQVLEPLAYIAASTVFTMHEKTDIAAALDAKVIEMFPEI